jgi:hypothetical protein
MAIDDVFPIPVQETIVNACNGQPFEDGWELMSKAMAEIASGETWVLKKTPGHYGGKYWNMEYAVLVKNKKVILYRVDEDGVRQEQLYPRTWFMVVLSFFCNFSPQ